MTNFINEYPIIIAINLVILNLIQDLRPLLSYHPIEVIPIWIYGFYKIYLPFSMPVFELFFTFDCLCNFIKGLIIDKPLTIILCSKTTWINYIFMLVYSFHEVRCNSDIKTSSFLICSYVYKSSFHNTEVVDPESSSG